MYFGPVNILPNFWLCISNHGTDLYDTHVPFMVYLAAFEHNTVVVAKSPSATMWFQQCWAFSSGVAYEIYEIPLQG